jgi:hypothetical protein
MPPLAFWVEPTPGPLPALLRGRLAPIGAPLVPMLVARRRFVAEVVRLVSQLRLSYRESPLSVEGSPRLRAGPRPGERLPDAPVICDGRYGRLHALIARPGVHVLLQCEAAPFDGTGAALGPHVIVHRLASTPGAGLVAVRPDGYVGFRCGIADLDQLRAWLVRAGAGVQGVSAA